MPGMDGTGPFGQGPMTGGGRGWCNPAITGIRSFFGTGIPFSEPYGGGVPYGGGYAPDDSNMMRPFVSNVPFVRGRGFGRGMGRGRKWWQPF